MCMHQRNWRSTTNAKGLLCEYWSIKRAPVTRPYHHPTPLPLLSCLSTLDYLYKLLLPALCNIMSNQSILPPPYQPAQRYHRDNLPCTTTTTSGSTQGPRSRRTSAQMTMSGTNYSPRYSTSPWLSCPRCSPGDHSTTPLDLTISPTSTHPSPRCHSLRDRASPPMARPTPPPSSRPPYQRVGMRTMVRPQDLSNPSNHPVLRLRNFLRIRDYSFTYRLRVTIHLQIPLPSVMCPCIT